MLLSISNTPRDYPWGRRGAISALLGGTPTDAIEAELWLGAHHGSPTLVLEPDAAGGAHDLVEATASIPALTGGTGRVPFLLKVIAPAAPLSLQAHPTAQQARDGFAREEAAGIALDAADRNYKDPFPKPELIVALEDGYQALAGLRPVQDAIAAFHHLAALPAVTDEDAESILEFVGLLDGGDDLPSVIARLLRRDADTVAVIEAVTRAALAAPGAFPVQATIAGAYPGDPGIVISLLLHHVTLRRGESVYLPAGNLHAYLDGIGIELMTASDNVLRGGLTPKHVDVPELLAVLDATPRAVPWLVPGVLAGGGVEYRPDDPGAGFGLAWVEDRATLPLTGPAIALCVDGGFTVTGERTAREITGGGALYASPDEGVLRIEGSGLVVVAR